MGVGGQRHAPVSMLPEKTRYPLYRRLGGPQSRSGLVRKLPGFDPRTVQPVASRYTDWAIPVPILSTVDVYIWSRNSFLSADQFYIIWFTKVAFSP